MSKIAYSKNFHLSIISNQFICWANLQKRANSAVRWALDTANEFRRLGGQCAAAGNVDSANEYFQRGKDLYKRLGKLIDQTRPKMS
jgi:hypothetical protein